MKEDLERIIEHFGVEPQRNKLAEEYRELQDELYKFVNDEPEEILKELVDVMAVTLQFMALAGYDFYLLEENIKKELNFKTKRTLERIESGYYEENK